ncbi:carboxymuconolactone decarboxylase family protein [uncultured Parolsenella sp.]|uniref:carboxymuconolactone decarboxylase family protein n=1 Tax=uncultured Parolsenella sp. TaxID=2083008 RepID=UPI0027DAD03B|nr:carboxymuconolactone decarboxylase family protein [uncultured Parolsenella sp.]
MLFGQVWSRTDRLGLRDCSLVTVVALMAMGLTDSSFAYHLRTAKENGITKDEIVEVVTHAAFYVGWPKAWAVFRMAKEVWGDEAAGTAPVAAGTTADDNGRAASEAESIFPIGKPNDAYAEYFDGQSYLAPVRPSRSASPTSRSSRDAATTGTSTTPLRAAVSCFCA